LQFAQANPQAKNCKRACLYASADFAALKKLNLLRQGNRMTELKKYLKPLIGKNAQLVTGGIFYCRVSAGFSVSASNKLSCILTGQCFEIGNKNIPPIRKCII